MRAAARLVTWSLGARRAFARKWFMLGFQLSGAALNGETLRLADFPALEGLFDAEFTRVYDRID